MFFFTPRCTQYFTNQNAAAQIVKLLRVLVSSFTSKKPSISSTFYFLEYYQSPRGFISFNTYDFTIDKFIYSICREKWRKPRTCGMLESEEEIC